MNALEWIFGLLKYGQTGRERRREPREEPSLVGPYPNGSVPYGDDPETADLRAKRFACAAKHHYPRTYTGSWCMGYGYVCGRCYMYADPVPQASLETMVNYLNTLPSDQQQMAAARMSGGGPRGGSAHD